MPPPNIKNVTVPDPIPCGKRIDVVVKVRVYENGTSLTVCFELQGSTPCRFVSLTEKREKRQKECRKRTNLPKGTHELTFRVRITCPKGDEYPPRVWVTARNHRGGMDKSRETWVVDCR